MQIPSEVLAEKNYAGTRLIEITDPKVMELRAEVAAFAPDAKPFLEKMEEYSKVLDPFYSQINEHSKEIKKLKDEMAPTKELFDAEVSQLEKIEQKAQLIKDKIQPMIMELIQDQLGEFEKALQLIDKDEKLYVEVVDEIEECVKKIRANKAKK